MRDALDQLLADGRSTGRVPALPTHPRASLFDIDAKYGDVVPSGEALEYMRGLA